MKSRPEPNLQFRTCSQCSKQSMWTIHHHNGLIKWCTFIHLKRIRLSRIQQSEPFFPTKNTTPQSIDVRSLVLYSSVPECRGRFTIFLDAKLLHDVCFKTAQLGLIGYLFQDFSRGVFCLILWNFSDVILHSNADQIVFYSPFWMIVILVLVIEHILKR